MFNKPCYATIFSAVGVKERDFVSLGYSPSIASVRHARIFSSVTEQ